MYAFKYAKILHKIQESYGFYFGGNIIFVNRRIIFETFENMCIVFRFCVFEMLGTSVFIKFCQEEDREMMNIG